MKKTLINPLLFILAFGALAFAYFSGNNKKPARILPYYGNKDVKGKDTVYHQIGNFSFYNQEGKAITQNDLKDKIYVADFFFTTCNSICPIMTSQMQRVYEKYKRNPQVSFLSHTVDPETDSIPVMAAYAKAHKADASKWHFLTGSKQDLYNMARTSYLVDAQEGDGGPDDFIHTPNFVLVDKEKRIRGYYDGTDSAEVERLIVDIEMLADAYNYKD